MNERTLEVIYSPAVGIPNAWRCWGEGIKAQVAMGVNPHDFLHPVTANVSRAAQDAFDALLCGAAYVFVWRNTTAPTVASCRVDRGSCLLHAKVVRGSTTPLELPDAAPFTSIMAVVPTATDAGGAVVCGDPWVYRTNSAQPAVAARTLAVQYMVDKGQHDRVLLQYMPLAGLAVPEGASDACLREIATLKAELDRVTALLSAISALSAS